MANPYTGPTISGYNASPPEDDGSQTSTNEITWAGIKTKITDPIKTLAEADITATSTAFEILNVTAGTAVASKAVVLGPTKNIDYLEVTTLNQGANNVVDDGDIGVTVQAYDAQLDDVSGLTPTADNFIAGDGANLVMKTPAQARTSLGVTATGADTTYAYRSNNLSDLTSASSARTNLGLGGLSVLNTVSGTEIDADAISESKVAWESSTESNFAVANNGFTYLPAGLHAGIYITGGTGSGTTSVDVYINTGWRTLDSTTGAGAWTPNLSALYGDNANVRVYSNGNGALTVYYRKLA